MVSPIGLAFGLGSSALSYFGQSRANQANIDVVREQQDFQRQMSNSAYQRAMADLKKAGLNPILAYKQGGASSTSGASIQQQNPLANLNLGEAVASATQVKQVVAQTKQTEAQTRLTNEQARATKLEADRMASVGDSIPGRIIDTGKKVVTNSAKSAKGAIERYLDRQKNSEWYRSVTRPPAHKKKATRKGNLTKADRAARNPNWQAYFPSIDTFVR